MLLGHRLVPAAFQIRDKILSEIDGRVADNGVSLPWVALMSTMTGAGNHVEVGSLFGASAIAVALLKKEAGLSGNVVCIDPYEPRDVNYIKKDLDDSIKEGTAEALMANAKKFGLDNIIHIKARSQPWPKELKGWTFTSGYIDGDHTGENPWLDFKAMAAAGCHHIGFDNYEEGFPDVVKAVRQAMALEDWMLYFKDTVFCAFRRPAPSRGSGINILQL